MSPIDPVPVIGGGPAGLFAADLLLEKGYPVDLYEGKGMAGRKYLLAGQSGLNITASEDIEKFASRYGSREDLFLSYLNDYSPGKMREWYLALGVETYVGTSGKVFPRNHSVKEILELWMGKLAGYGNFQVKANHKFCGWTGGKLYFTDPRDGHSGDRLSGEELGGGIFALGGASWPSTGSDGAWTDIFRNQDIDLIPFQPMNCGYSRKWSPYFLERFANSPVKNLSIEYDGEYKRGDLTVTADGLEGGPLYWFSRNLTADICNKGRADIFLDLTPDLSLEEIKLRLNRERGKKSLSTFLRRVLSLDPVKTALIRECLSPDDIKDYSRLAPGIKSLPLRLTGTAGIDKAISVSGGVDFNETDEFLMLRKRPGWFCAGEMLDWDSPTGGYLLQGCFSTAYRAVRGYIKYHDKKN